MADVTQELVKTPTFTEWLAGYDEQPSEVIAGEVVLMHPPDFVHSGITNELGYELQTFAKKHDLGRVFIETATVLDADDEANWVKGAFVPDIFLVANTRLSQFMETFAGTGPLRLAPDMAVEIVSTNDSYTTINRKVEMYLVYGVQLVWVIDPARRKIRVHTPDNPTGDDLDDTATLDGGAVLSGWSMPVSDIMNVPGMDSKSSGEQ